MTAKNTLVMTLPRPVEQAIKRLGANLRTARLRRNLTIENVAEKIGTGPRAVSDAEKGKVSTSPPFEPSDVACLSACKSSHELADHLRIVGRFEDKMDVVGH